MRLFADRGTTQLSLTEVAAEAGIARGTIYNNIPNPEALFSEVASDLADEMIARIEQTLSGVDDPGTRLATGVRLFVRRAHEERHWGRFIARFAMGRNDLQRLMEAPPARDVTLLLDQGNGDSGPARVKALVAMLTGSTLAAINAVIEGHQTWRDAGELTSEYLLLAAGLPAKRAARISRERLPDLVQYSTPNNNSVSRRAK